LAGRDRRCKEGQGVGFRNSVSLRGSVGS
jgi:hypothetical protein